MATWKIKVATVAVPKCFPAYFSNLFFIKSSGLGALKCPHKGSSGYSDVAIISFGN